MDLKDFEFLTRIHYLAGSDDIWGEHESKIQYSSSPFLFILIHAFTYLFISIRLCLIKLFILINGFNFQVDYILILKGKDVEYKENLNEVKSVKYVDRKELLDMFEKGIRIINLDSSILKLSTPIHSYPLLSYSIHSYPIHSYPILFQDDISMTPWFQLIVKNFLLEWWDNLDDLKKYQDNKIHRM